MGEILWREAPVEADLVISVPDSGNPAAAGFARASGLPRDDGLIKNRYVARTFIQPGQELRKHGLRLKFNPLPEIVAGQRIVVVDDSIVRGNTTRQIVGMLRDAGASEVHLRISAPPIRNPCHYGVDMSTREEMIAHNRTIEEIADELDADSLAYLSMDGVYEAIGGARPRTTATPASAATTRSATPTSSARSSASADERRWRVSRDELEFSYRHSALGPRGLVVGPGRVSLSVRRGKLRRSNRKKVADLNARRKATQPINRRTFGSVFKNPDEGLGAGADARSLRAQGPPHRRRTVSPRHANFIENADEALGPMLSR